MKIVSVEVMDDEVSTCLRREARRTRRDRRANLSSCDPIEMWHSDLSAFRALIHLFKDTASVEPQLPSVAKGLIGNHVGDDDIALLRFARGSGSLYSWNFSGNRAKLAKEIRTIPQAA